jgi:hypothetical protein
MALTAPSLPKIPNPGPQTPKFALRIWQIGFGSFFWSLIFITFSFEAGFIGLGSVRLVVLYFSASPR